MLKSKESIVRRRALQTDKYELKNLRFLGDFMKTVGLSTTSAGEKIGVSQVAIYYWLKKDDAKLSVVNKLIDACGYKLTFEYVSPEDFSESSTTKIVIDAPDDRLLSFLSVALADYDKEEVSKKIGLGGTTVYYWISHDDMFVSYIFKIAEAIGKKVIITIRKK